ncbi:MAG: hypothetical protein ACRD52_08405 [Candidatus Acidiferrales bacterium]
MRRCAAFSGFALLLFCTSSCAAQQSRIVKVTIESQWGGLGTPSETEVVILRDADGYKNKHEGVDRQLVESLVAALNAPALAKPELENLGISQPWLEANAIPAVETYAGSFDDAAPNQKALYRVSFTNETLIRKVVLNLFNFVSTDDYPSVKVEATLEDGSSVSATSNSQYLFMLPWKVKRSGQEVATYNADISRAVVALMPKKSTNRSRIAGQGLDVDLAEAVMRYIEKDWKLLDVENRVGGTLATLRSRYTVESAEINPYHGVAYGVAWKGNQPHEENLHVVLRRASFPPSFSENVILLYKDGTVSGTDEFLQNASKYEELVLAVPWMKGLTEKYPAYSIELLWVHNRSFGEKAMNLFAADMNTMGKSALADEVRSEQDKIALITIRYGDYWLVFPDKRMVLWRYNTVSGLLNFKPSDFPYQRCSDYNTVTGGCVGIIVLPDGTLAK